MMPKLLVIADDFTGALDTGVQFSNYGINTLVTTNKSVDYKSLKEKIDVLVIDTESRYLSSKDSYQIVNDIALRASRYNISYIYKKVDSALRGNISSEIKALLDAFPNIKIPMIPAFPDVNRVVKQGRLIIDGVPVSESVFADDPYEPVVESNILKRLQYEEGISGSLIESGKIDYSSQLLLFDSETNSDLENISNFLLVSNLLKVSVGCAGFAKYLVKQLFPNRRRQEVFVKKPLVVMCGSVNPITRRQIEFAEKKNYKRISLTARDLLEPDFWLSEDGTQKISSYLDEIETADLLIFETLSKKTSQGLTEYAKKYNLSKQDVRFRIGQSLGMLTKQLFCYGVNRTFLFTGGDTLFQSMSVLHIDQLRPIGEVTSGVVLVELDWRGKSIQVITKSGGFGPPDLFDSIVKLYKNYQEDEHVS